MAEEQQQDDQRKTGLKIPTPWGPLEVRGLGTMLSLTLTAVALIGYMVFKMDQKLDDHGAKTQQSIESLRDEMAAQTYVLTLGQKERESLNLSMPHSLRKKMARDEAERFR